MITDKFIFKGKEYELYKVNKIATKNYKEKTKGNKFRTDEEVRLKLTRNILSCIKSKINKKNQTVYKYGSLWIYVDDTTKTIKNVRNKVRNNPNKNKINKAVKVGLDNILFRDGLSKTQYVKYNKIKQI